MLSPIYRWKWRPRGVRTQSHTAGKWQSQLTPGLLSSWGAPTLAYNPVSSFLRHALPGQSPGLITSLPCSIAYAPLCPYNEPQIPREAHPAAPQAPTPSHVTHSQLQKCSPASQTARPRSGLPSIIFSSHRT